MDFVIRDRRGKDTKGIVEIEKAIDGWTKEDIRRETKPPNRLAMVALVRNEIVSWCLCELTDEITVLRISQNPHAVWDYEITDAFLRRLIAKLQGSRRSRVVLLVQEDRTEFLCHLRDDLGFRAVDTHRDEYTRDDGDTQILIAGIEMERRKWKTK